MSVVRLIAVRESELSVDEVRAAVADPAAGGIALFAGAVRDSDHDRGVSGLSYSAHPSAADAIAAALRVGALPNGDLAVGLAVSCPHRQHDGQVTDGQVAHAVHGRD